MDANFIHILFFLFTSVDIVFAQGVITLDREGQRWEVEEDFKVCFQYGVLKYPAQIILYLKS